MPNKNRLDVDGGESPLKQLREAVGLTQEELARRIGVSTRKPAREKVQTSFPPKSDRAQLSLQLRQTGLPYLVC